MPILAMPRTARASAAGYCYHVLNRGNARATVFHKDGDYDAFLEMMAETSLRVPMRIIAYCLMPNHFHMALWPRNDGDLSSRSPRNTSVFSRPGDQDAPFQAQVD